MYVNYLPIKRKTMGIHVSSERVTSGGGRGRIVRVYGLKFIEGLLGNPKEGTPRI